MTVPEVEAEERQVGDGRDAVRAVGDVRARDAVHVVHGDTEDLSEAEGHDGEVVAAQAQGGGADEDTEDQRRCGAGEGGRPEGELDAGELRELGAGDQGGRVGADAEEGDVAEVEESGEAYDDVEAEGDGAEDQDVHAEVGVVVVGLCEREADRGDEAHGEREAAVVGREVAEPVEETCGVQGPRGEHDDDEEADEELVLGVDAVREDGETEGGDDRDDESLDPGGCVLRCRDPLGLGDGRLEGFLGGVGGVLREGEGADHREQGGHGGDVGAGLPVDDATEFRGDRDDRVPGDREGAEGGEDQGRVVAGGQEPAESSDAVGGEGEHHGDEAGDEGQDLQAAGVAVDREVTGEVGGPGPAQERGRGGEDAAAEQQGAGRGEGQRDDAALCRGRGGRRLGGLGGLGRLGHVITPCPRRVRRADLVA